MAQRILETGYIMIDETMSMNEEVGNDSKKQKRIHERWKENITDSNENIASRQGVSLESDMQLKKIRSDGVGFLQPGMSVKRNDEIQKKELFESAKNSFFKISISDSSAGAIEWWDERRTTVINEKYEDIAE
ncbi:unnamed protein product [Onchocerca flexuosa]|uniref:Uncharacterized protein n=1 Tax=Onchocerca flexuosa TaxID=387005 RepID=A0A183I0Z1_9BILA|nr:unnamed protein product [Onchocerca flexuosa]